ncbi:hypothetical protein ABZ725_14305 [Streptomyces sp. NPDC006872]|uniref:hypothetical protein n=1 Tax=Streptomyces sp. NPDC006872 TaxID=3155720 RepID=UPI0033CC7A4C
MTNHTGASVRADHPTERSLSLSLEAEVMADADTGRLALVASTDPQLSDFAETSPARLRQMVTAARACLAEFERLADEQEARDTLAALLAEQDVAMIEAPLDKLMDVNDDLADRLACWAMESPDGRHYVIVPAGQDPIARVAAVRRVIEDMRGAS